MWSRDNAIRKVTDRFFYPISLLTRNSFPAPKAHHKQMMPFTHLSQADASVTANSSQSSDKGTESSEKPTPKPSLRQRFKTTHQGWEDRYKEWQKKKPATDKLGRFVLKNIVYGTAAYFVAYFFKEYIDASKQIDHTALAIESQTLRNSAELEKMRALRAQPFLYLTTSLTAADHQEYNKNRVDLLERINQLKQYAQELKKAAFVKRFLRGQIKQLVQRLEREITQLEIAYTFNETIWLQKNRQYKAALEKNKAVIEQLVNCIKNKINTSFSTDHILSAAYNAQAKLQACLAFFSERAEDVKNYREDSLKSYDAAIKNLADIPENQVELAILKSSKAYLLTDCGRPEEALLLHREANTLKPNDEHILCGVALDLHMIEKNKKPSQAPDLGKLDEAYGYFSRALQLNDKVPNIYVSRGKLLLDLNDISGALKDFDTALALDKHHSEAHLQKAHILLQKKDCDGSEMHFKKGLLFLLDRPWKIKEENDKLVLKSKELSSTCASAKKGTFY